MAGKSRVNDVAGRFAARWMTSVDAAPGAALAALGVLFALALWAASTLSVDSDSSKMLSPDLPFQARSNALNEAFPDLKRSIAVVVGAETADDADAAVLALRDRLARRDEAIRDVFAPSVDPFFMAHGFLYGDLAAVERRLAAFSSASNLIATLRDEPRLDAFVGVLVEARRQAERAAADRVAGGPDPADEAFGLERIYAETAAVFDAALAGAPRSFSWSGALDPAGPSEARRVVRTLIAAPILDYDRLNPAKAALAAVEEEIAALPADLTRAVEIGVTGDPALRADELASVTANLATSLMLSLLAVAALLRLGFRSVRRAGLAVATLVVTLVLTAGLAALFANPLNLVSVAFVVLMVGLGIDYAIHLMMHIEEASRRGAAHRRALKEAGDALGGPLALSAATTAASFGAFMMTDFVGMAQLGLIGGLGVVVALLVAATLVPAAIAVKPSLIAGRPPRPLARIEAPNWMFGAARMARQSAPLVVVAIGVAAISLAQNVRFDADPMNLRPSTAPSVIAFERLNESGAASPLRLSVLVDDAEDARTTAERLRAAPEVASASWLGDLTPTRQDDKLQLFDLAYPSLEHAVSGAPTTLGSGPPKTLEAGLDALKTQLASGRTAAEAALARTVATFETRSVGPGGAEAAAAVEAAVFKRFPAFLDRLEAMLSADYVTPEALPAALLSRYRAPSGALRVDVAPVGEMTDAAERARFVDAVAAAEPRAAGGALQIEAAGATVAGAIAAATFLSLAATGALAWFALGELRLVAAIVVPLGVAGLITAAASVLLEIPFNYANVIVLPLMIGIGVDSGVHLASRAARLDKGGSLLATSTPRAVVYSALTTMAAFGALSLSDHRGTASMGSMLMIGVGAAVLCVLALTPRLSRLGQDGPQ